MAAVGGNGPKRKRATRFICNVPAEYCNARPHKDGCRDHSSIEEVRRCMAAYLIKKGYKQVGNREFENPDTGCILILSKKPSRAKPGKETRYMKRAGKVAAW